MKMRMLFVLLGLLIVAGCGFEVSDNKGYRRILYPTSHLNPDVTVTVEGCEYFVVDAHGSKTYVHKGNCNNPIHPYNK